MKRIKTFYRAGKLHLRTIVWFYLTISSIVVISVIAFGINRFQKTIILEAKETGKILTSIIVAYRNYLADLNREFISNCSETDKNGTAFNSPFVCAPAYVTSHALSRIKSDFKIKQVSDVPRNPNNKAIGEELKAIQFFKENPKMKDYFTNKDGNFFYAYPLKVTKSCLKCHGSIDTVPKNIYSSVVKQYGVTGFGYDLGDVRGILAVYIPQQQVYRQLNDIKKIGVAIGVTLLILIGIGVILWMLFKVDLEQLTDIIPDHPELAEQHFDQIQTAQFRFKELEGIRNNWIQFVKLFIKNKEEREQSYYRKSLTNLPSLFALYKEIKETSGREFNLIVLDVDKFREINQTFGLESGNEIIREIARKLQAILSKNSNLKLYHIDIDKFAVQVPYSWTKPQIKHFTYYLLKELEGPYDLNGLMIRFRAGVAYRTTKPLLRSSLALDQAKERNLDIVFDDEVDSLLDDYHTHLTYLKELKYAIEHDNIVPFYQPIVDKKGKVVKYEALVRMVDQKGQIVPPIFFLPIAKKSRLNSIITKIMVEKSLKRFRYLPYGISINLTVDDAENEEIRDFIIKQVKKFPEPERIIFEMVENEYAGDSSWVISFFKELKQLGCKIYIDDFGSGYANFEYLIRLNADGIKIDGSLIKNILRDRGSEVIVKSVVGFAQEMGMEIVAEFVENREIFDKLKGMGIQYFQGYYFSAPLSYIPDDSHFPQKRN